MTIKKVCLLFMLVLFALAGYSRVYYFSNTGNDKAVNNSISSPWNSINKVNSLIYKPGDVVLFQSGGRWNGTIQPHGSGAKDNPVIFGRYGSGVNPVITGFTALRNWSYAGNGIYKSNTITMQSFLRVVTIDGQLTGQGRYPNTDAGNDGYLSYENFWTDCIQDWQITIDSSWIGGDLAMRTSRAYVDKGRITKVDKEHGYIFYEYGNMAKHPWAAGYGYFITNHIKTLDEYGEWFYSDKEQALYVYFGSSNPAQHTVQVSTTDVLVKPTGSNYVFDGIDLTGANKYSIESSWKDIQGLTVKNSTINYAGINAIALACRRSFTLDNVSIGWANCNGVMIGYRCDNAIVQNSYIHDIAMLPANYYRDTTYQGRTGFGLFSSNQQQTGVKAINNTFGNIGYAAIFFDGSNNLLEKNYIEYACSKLDDGGAIYSYNMKDSLYTNNVIRQNVILYTKGSPLGTVNYLQNMASGIYADNNARYIAYNNFVAYSGQAGMFIHNAYVTAYNNSFAFNYNYQLYIMDDNTAPAIKTSFVFNSLYAAGGEQLLYGFYTGNTAPGSNAVTNFGKVDSNYVYNANTKAAYVSDWSVNNFTAFWDWQQWRANTGYDKQTKQVNNVTSYRVYYTNRTTQTYYFKGQVLYDIKGRGYKDSIKMADHNGGVLFSYLIN